MNIVMQGDGAGCLLHWWEFNRMIEVAGSGFVQVYPFVVRIA